MKKRNEGYTLPLVLVVMIVLCLVAVGVMSVSLHNLQAQKASVSRMQDKYAAQGELEKAVANLEKELTKQKVVSANKIGDAQSAAQAVILDALGVNEQNSTVKLQEGKSLEWKQNTNGALSCTVFLRSTDVDEQVEVICSIYLDSVLVLKEGEIVYFYNNPKAIYTSYQIGGVSDA